MESTVLEKYGPERMYRGPRLISTPQQGSRKTTKTAQFVGPSGGGERTPRRRWRREKNWKPTFSRGTTNHNGLRVREVRGFGASRGRAACPRGPASAAA